MNLLWRMVILSFFFGQILAKTCSIMVSRGICMGMGRRGDFSKICSFFPQGICTFFVFRWEKNAVFASFFWCPFFFFTRVSFKKQQKKLNPHSKVKQQIKLGKKSTRNIDLFEISSTQQRDVISNQLKFECKQVSAQFW